MLAVIATLWLQPRSWGTVTGVSDSLLVRTSCPSRSEISGNAPPCLQRASSRLVPSTPAATTTPRAVWVRRFRVSHAPERWLVTAYPSDPSAAPSGRIDVTVRSGRIGTPRPSASHRYFFGTVIFALCGQPRTHVPQEVQPARGAPAP